MTCSIGASLFVLAPAALGGLLLWRYPETRRVRIRSLVFYVVVMSLLIGAALEVVAYIAGAKVPIQEVGIVLWFTIAWRLLWAIWKRSVGRWGQRWVRWARLQKRRGQSVPLAVRLIPFGRATLTATIFIPLFLSTVLTHRCKLRDGEDPFTTFNMRFESVRIPARSGLTLDGWFIPEKGAERTILICHGAGANKGNFVWFLGPLAYRGYNVMFFDFRAHGASDGRTATYGISEREDVLSAVDWLKREHPEQSKVLVGLGSSQGAMALALAAAADPRIDAVILDSPFISPHELAMERAGMVPVLGRLAVDWLLALMSLQTGTSFFAESAEKAVASLGSRPVMIIHGDEDVVMPASHSRRLFEAATGPREIWYGPGPHSNIITTDPAGYAERMFRFLEQHLGAPPMFRSRGSRPADTGSAPG